MKASTKLALAGFSLLGLGFILTKKKSNQNNSTSNFSSDSTNELSIPNMSHPHMDAIRNPKTSLSSISLTVPKIQLSLPKSGGKVITEDGDPIPNSVLSNMKKIADNPSIVTYKYLNNKGYLSAYKGMVLNKNIIQRPIVNIVKNQVLYMLSDADKDNTSGTFKVDEKKMKNNAMLLARLLSKEVGFESGRSEQRSPSSKFVNDSNIGIDSKMKTEYSSLGSIGFSREASAVLWCALNRFKMSGKFTDILDMLEKTNWNKDVSDAIKADIQNGTPIDQRYVDFVSDFIEGKYPNEIGHRRSFIHYPAMINISKKIPDWALPHNHSLYPLDRGGSKTTGGYLIHSAIFSDNTYDTGSASKILPYVDSKRN